MTPAARAVMRYGAPPLAGSTRTEVMPGPAQPPPLDRVASARSRLEGLSREMMALRLSVDEAVARATLDAMAGEVMAVRALLAPSEVVTEPEVPAEDLCNGCTTHHAACACGEARHRAELAALRLELDVERAVSASLREQLASLADRTLSGDLLAAFKGAVSRAPSSASDPQPQEGVTFFRGSGTGAGGDE